MRESGTAAKQIADGCLNCGAAIGGPFCAACGQRVVPADPTFAELAGDAWQELSGYDGRIASTVKALIRPGQLTRDYLEGRRAHFLSPVRLYVTASVIYFLVAAAAPQLSQSPAVVTGPGGLRVGLSDNRGRQLLTTEDRAEIDADLQKVSWPFRQLLQAVSRDPAAFREHLFTVMPRVFFALLPVFAGIVWLFYRHRRFPAALVFAVHLHAFAFLIFAISEASKFSGTTWVAGPVAMVTTVVFAVYALRSLREVFGGGWPMTLAKATAIGLVYLIASMPAFLIMLVWASLV